MRYFLLLFGVWMHTVLIAQSPGSSGWYKMIVGKTGKYPITLHLHQAGQQYFGYYYYHSTQQPIYFSGEDTTQPGTITLSGYPEPDLSETFWLSLNNNRVSGSWTHSAGKTSLPVTGQVVLPSIPFQQVYTEGQALLRPQLDSSPTAHYFAAAVWPTKPTTAPAIVADFIRQSLFRGYSGKESIGTLLLRDKKRVFAEYRQEYEEMSDQEVRDAPFPLQQSFSTQLMIVYQSSSLLSFGQQQYAYTGGAHGNYGTTYSTLDLRTGKKLELAQVVTPSGKARLGRLLEAAFRRQRHLKPTDSLTDGGLFENRLEPNNNFYVTGKGIAFNYVPYEIGPYAVGEIQLFIPFTQLSAHLKPAFQRLVGNRSTP